MSHRYKSPPIAEAICEFRFAQNLPWDFTVPGLVYEKLRKNFPIRRQVAELNHFLVAGIKKPNLAQFPLMRFLKEDKSTSIQVGENIVTINLTEPYTSWEEFKQDMQEALQAYLAVTNAERFDQVLLYYLNRLEFADDVCLEDYLNFRPFLAGADSQIFRPFLVNGQLPGDDSNGTTNLQLGTLERMKRDTLNVALDIRYALSDPTDIRLNNVFGRLDKAHARVEEAFEACITDKLRQRFGEVTDAWNL